MNLNVREKIFVIGLILSLVVFLTINAVSYWNTKRHIESRANVEKTLVIIYEFENLISLIKDAETGQRGFIITGDRTFLEPYYNGVTSVYQSMRKLKELMPIDAQSHQKLDTIEGMIEKRFAQFHKAIGLRKNEGIAVAIKSFMTAENENVMFDIRNLVEGLKREKTDLLQGLNRISKARSQRTLFTIFFGNLIALLFVFFSLFQLYRDITEGKRVEEELKASQQQLRSLTGRFEEIREEERIIISREIHDMMGGGLTGLKLDLSWLMNKVKNAESDNGQAAMTCRILSSIESIDKMIKVTRRISTELRPPVLDDLGLIAALEWQLSDFTSRTGVLHKFTTAYQNVTIEKDKAVAVFRISQEILTNIARHSEATKVVVALLEDEENSFRDENFILEIRDNGRGIKEEEILDPKALGLLGMKERALSFGGKFLIFGHPGGGTSVTVKIPRNLGGP
ncbi:MAG: CHASE3 domain-containing protein [Proteobacteria bacterium]|nr:CHASE3 domain-containing protein [Pseudomonadota bacterium]